MPSLSKKKLLLLGFLFAILIVIPITVYLVQQQQQTQSRANPNTKLSFSPEQQTASVGGQAKFDIIVSPGNNQVNFIKLAIKYDSTKLEATEDSFEVDPTSNLSIIQGPVIGSSGDEISVVLSVQSDPTKVIQKDTKIGTVTFDVLAASEVPTQISFDATQIQVRSINGGNNDAFNENVFLNGAPATLTIQGEAETTPTPIPSESPSPTPSVELTPTATPSPGGGTPSTNQAPVCSNLLTDVATDGTAPYTITFTASGSDADGTVEKATFNYGEDAIEDVTGEGGLGTNSVNVQRSHTYNSGGTFTASAVLTDDQAGVSDSSSCNVTVNINGGSSTSSESADVTPLAATGPTSKVVGVGALGGLLFLIGILLFFAL